MASCSSPRDAEIRRFRGSDSTRYDATTKGFNLMKDCLNLQCRPTRPQRGYVTEELIAAGKCLQFAQKLPRLGKYFLHGHPGTC